MNELALFAGAGGGILGGKLLGWRTVCAVEWEPYAAGVLAARQNDKVLEAFPIWDDVQTFDGNPWRGIVDVVSGGFPCQDISSAGKRAGIDGERSSMWKHMARVVREVRPEWVFVENSPMLVSRGLGTVLRDLAESGFDAAWTVLSAADVGAPHIRERIWICAHSNSVGWGRRSAEFRARNNLFQSSGLVGKSGAWKETAKQKARILGMDDGVAAGVERLKATGNGQVPRVAAAAFAMLAEQLMMTPNAEAHATPKAVACSELRVRHQPTIDGETTMGTFTTKLKLGGEAFGVSGGLDPTIQRLTVGQIRVTETLPGARFFTEEPCYKEEYMCVETGVGSGTIWTYGKNIFATYAEAQTGVIAHQQAAYKQRAERDAYQAQEAERKRLDDLRTLERLKKQYEAAGGLVDA